MLILKGEHWQGKDVKEGKRERSADKNKSVVKGSGVESVRFLSLNDFLLNGCFSLPTSWASSLRIIRE